MLVCREVSIHAPREGSDARCTRKARRRGGFNPRPPRGERLYIPQDRKEIVMFQSTPPERGATPDKLDPEKFNWVSIHAPREGSDPPFCGMYSLPLCFNPRPPRGERRYWPYNFYPSQLFQSTPPERGATGKFFIPAAGSAGFNPRPPRGERLVHLNGIGDGVMFQSTPPERGATRPRPQGGGVSRVSIHAPREGSDLAKESLLSISASFNPRPPRGERLLRIDLVWSRISVSIHAPREGSDIYQGYNVGLD